MSILKLDPASKTLKSRKASGLRCNALLSAYLFEEQWKCIKHAQYGILWAVAEVFFQLCEWIRGILSVEPDAPSVFILEPFATIRMHNAFTKERSQRTDESVHIVWIALFVLERQESIQPFNRRAVEINIDVQLVASE